MSETVTVLMPKISDLERFRIRYRGLENRLGELGVQPTFADSQDSYDPAIHGFKRHFSTNDQTIEGVRPEDVAVVRDLTIPKSFDRPLYNNRQAPRIVRDPALNAYLRDKSNLFGDLPGLHPETVVAPSGEVMNAATLICGQSVVVKPAIGMESKDIYIGPADEVPAELSHDKYIVSEFIDTSGGIPELEIHGVHNLRVISINSKLIGAVGRIKGNQGLYLHEDVYGKVYLPEQLPESMVKISEAVQDLLKGLPGGGKNVIAIDLMRGINAAGNEVDVICEINRRPLRISEYDLDHEPGDDPKGIEWLANQWDLAEAGMLIEAAAGE